MEGREQRVEEEEVRVVDGEVEEEEVRAVDGEVEEEEVRAVDGEVEEEEVRVVDGEVEEEEGSGGGWRGGGGGGSGGGWRGGGGGGSGGGWRGGGGGAETQSTQRVPLQASLDRSCPYRGWSLYFTEGFVASSPAVEKIRVFEKYFSSRIHLYDKDEIERQGSVLVDYADLVGDGAVLEALPEIVTELKEQPELLISCLGAAVHQVLTVDLEKQAAELQEDELPVSTPIVSIPHISARLYNYEPLAALRTLRAAAFGRLVSVKGTVIRVSSIRPRCARMAFICQGCSAAASLPLQHGKYCTPTKCVQPGCRSRSFLPVRNSPLTHTVDWQIIKIQELMGGEQREAGRIPRSVECHLTSDLCDSCVPGDTVTVTGIVRVTNDGGSRGNKDQCMFLLYIDATSVSNTKGHQAKSGGQGSGAPEDRPAGEEFSLKELYAVQEIQAQPHLLRLIVHSLCPVIYGHLMVKAALALALFGGRQKHTDRNSVPVRGDPHILLVGDPGLGKSQMLQAVCNVAPRGIYVCGNSTSTTGLTVSLSRDAGTGDFALEAGALVLADQGTCCIDEFDKLGGQQQALLEAMEQQSVSLAKAGIVSSLPARASVVAAANPAGGHYNRAKTVSENLKMGSALLSRFDVVFLLLDVPDESHDRRLSEHIMAHRTGRGRAGGAEVSRAGGAEVSRAGAASESSILLEHADLPLSERLQVPAGETLDAIPACLLRKYVSYARQYVRPSLSPEAAQTLQDFYLSLRAQAHSADATPITTRQLESLIRLTEARAKLELRETATKSDADDVVEIMKHSLADTYSDGLGNLDFERSQHGSGMSQRGAAKRLVGALHSHAQRTGQKQFDLQTLRSVAERVNIKVLDFDGLLSSLNEQGFLLKRGAKLYQLQTVSRAAVGAGRGYVLARARVMAAQTHSCHRGAREVNAAAAPLTALVIFRDVGLIAAVFWVRYKTVPPPVTLSKFFNPCYTTAQLQPTLFSKVNTAIQLCLVAASLAAPVFHFTDSVLLQGLWYVTAVTTAASGYSYWHYGRKTVRVLNTRPPS
ncbi:LOW QUALITY PROTEIN: DNA helicase MCM8 [Salarias fasciatus]|uniref:LOW QUALITY PROTEIN: DNA helicase MCM8 n=1 Tax=Salarias fasciatus TaxID=181472 RepID=UPI0011769180|nr:LOW QUALITY PROTEIN: DNA helicase MCM8-like [Salarias fasciatus]